MAILSIRDLVDFGTGSALNCCIVAIDHDPTVTSTDVPKGSLLIRDTGQWYRKTADGDNTSVNEVGA